MGKVNRPPPKYKATRRPVLDVRADLPAILERFADRLLLREDGCVEWTGFKSHLGYGSTCWRNRQWMAHRLIYAAHRGPFDPWLDVRHSCDNPACVNIEHLSLGTRSDNMRDAVDRRRAKNAQKTHCPRGHEYDYVFNHMRSTYKEWRRCSTCDRARHRIRAGWPPELAYSLPPQPLGYRPEGLGNWDYKQNRRRRRAHRGGGKSHG